VGRSPSTIADIVSRRRAKSIADVIDRPRAIDSSLPANDGVAWFTKLYLRVTEAVEAKMAEAAGLRDPALLVRLDVFFANLYFDALGRAARDLATAPKAWAPLFEAQTAEGIAPIQFALAGTSKPCAAGSATHGVAGQRHCADNDYRRLRAVGEGGGK
jgi:hypothetical protein